MIKAEEEQMISKKVFTLEEITMKTSRRKCLICDKDLDKDMPNYNWHIPLCKKHRMKMLEEIK